MTDTVELYKILHGLKIAFPHIEREREPESVKEMLKLYATMLADLPIDALRTAAAQIIAESKWFPTVAELREKVHAMRRVVQNVPTWEAAWNEAMGEVRRCGYQYWCDTKFSTELIKETAKMYWRDICLVDMEQLQFVRANFRDTYNARVRREEDTATRLPVTNNYILRLSETWSRNGKLPFGELESPKAGK